MSDQTGAPPAGWYNDPSNPNQQRWWDGSQWSASTRPLTDGPNPTVPPSAEPAGGPFTQPPTLDPVGPTAPATQPMTPGPGSPPDAAPPIVIGSGGGRSVGKVVLVAAGAMLVLGGCVVLFASSSAAPTESTTDEVGGIETEVTPVRPDAVETIPPTSAPAEPAEEVEEVEANDEVEADDATGRFGTREEPLAFDQPVDVTWASFGDGDGSVWTTTIGPPRDITDQVLATNQFNDPPPDGVRFVGFEAELTLVEATKEPLAPAFNFSWEILGGATARVYGPTTIETPSFGCGVTPNSFDDFDEVFAGGTLTGTVCVPIPTEDLDHPDTRVSLNFSDGDRAIFGP